MQSFLCFLLAVEISVITGALAWAIKPYREPVKMIQQSLKSDRLSVKDRARLITGPWPVKVIVFEKPK
jgi:hypothetical protein